MRIQQGDEIYFVPLLLLWVVDVQLDLFDLKISLMSGNLIIAHHRLFLQAFIVEILPVQDGSWVVAGDTILDYQRGDRRF